MDQLDGKVAVITGAGSGIGLASSKLFAQQGMKVVMSDINGPRLQEEADKLLAEGLTVHPVQADVSDYDQMRGLADAAYDTYGAVHIAWFNAGIGSGAGFADDGDTTSWRTIVDVNVLQTVWGIKCFLGRMTESGEEGLIMTTSSGAGVEGTASLTPSYAATKIAVMSLIESLFGQLKRQNSMIRAAVVLPPLTNTRVGGEDPGTMEFVETMIQSQGVPAKLVEAGPVAQTVLDGVLNDRFFIRVGQREDELFFGSAHPAEYWPWAEKMMKGRGEAIMADTDPSGYIW